MKYFKLFLISVMFFIPVTSVDAATTLSTSISSVYTGNSFTISVKVSGVAAWNVKINVSGVISSSNCGTLAFADSSSNAKNTTKTLSVNCKTNKVGVINISVSGDTTTEKGVTQNVSGSKQVKVINKPAKPATSTKPTQTLKPKSSVNYLSSLSIDGVELSPKFEKEVSQYSVELGANYTSIIIKATKQDNKSSVSGIGKIEVTEGTNILKVTVTAENGSKRTYTIKATVKERDPIEITIGNKTYNVIQKRETLISASAFYKETLITIKGEKVPGYYGEVTGYNLIGLKDSDGNIELYIYDDDEFRLYKEHEFGRGVLYLIKPLDQNIPIEFVKSNIEIGDNIVEGYVYKDNRGTILLYGMNIENKNIGFYQYDKIENTIQRYDGKIMDIKNSKIKKYTITIFCLASMTAILGIIFILKLKKTKV